MKSEELLSKIAQAKIIDKTDISKDLASELWKWYKEFVDKTHNAVDDIVNGKKWCSNVRKMFFDAVNRKNESYWWIGEDICKENVWHNPVYGEPWKCICGDDRGCALLSVLPEDDYDSNGQFGKYSGLVKNLWQSSLRDVVERNFQIIKDCPDKDMSNFISDIYKEGMFDKDKEKIVYICDDWQLVITCSKFISLFNLIAHKGAYRYCYVDITCMNRIIRYFVITSSNGILVYPMAHKVEK